MSRRRTPQFSTFASWGMWLLSSVLGFALSLAAQQPAAASTQTSPNSSPTRQQNPPSTDEGSAAKFIGYATNPSTFFPDIATSPGPLSAGGKFKLFVNQSISPPYILEAAFSAAYDQARNVPKGNGQGWGAYGSRFGADMARSSSSSFFGTFLLASLLDQDPRFFPESKPSFWRSLKYSTQRVVITRNDSGRDVFNTSGLLGPLASEGLANMYLPSSEQTVGKTLTRFAGFHRGRFTVVFMLSPVLSEVEKIVYRIVRDSACSRDTVPSSGPMRASAETESAPVHHHCRDTTSRMSCVDRGAQLPRGNFQQRTSE
jgi:hypothetical protein